MWSPVDLTICNDFPSQKVHHKAKYKWHFYEMNSLKWRTIDDVMMTWADEYEKYIDFSHT